MWAMGTVGDAAPDPLVGPYWLQANDEYGNLTPYGGVSLCTDSQGNVYITNTYTEYIFQPSFQFIDTPILRKVDRNGQLIWEKKLSGRGRNSFAAFNEVTQELMFAASVDATTTDPQGAVVLALDPTNGNVVWQTNIQTSTGCGASTISVDSSGNTWFLGWSNKPNVQYRRDAIAARWSPTKALLWAKAFNSSGDYDDARIVATRFDEDENLQCAISSGGNDWKRLFKLSPQGVPSSSLSATTSVSRWLYDMVLGLDGDVYTTWSEYPSTIIARYTPSGTLVWSKIVVSSNNIWLAERSLSVDLQGNIYVAMSDGPSEDWSKVLKLSATGELLWTRRLFQSWYGDPNEGYGSQKPITAITVDDANNLLLAAMNTDSLLVKVAADGSHTFSGQNPAYGPPITYDDLPGVSLAPDSSAVALGTVSYENVVELTYVTFTIDGLPSFSLSAVAPATDWTTVSV